ncbi:MAG: DNA topoisomerase IB [Chitinophagaceae bacterium]
MIAIKEEKLKIPAVILEKISTDPIATAKAIKLVYVTNEMEGYTRQKKGKGFIYVLNKKQIKNKAALHRIKSLVIPPAWQNVWVCPLENGHLQATGLDAAKRKQYRYHPSWNKLRNHTKFYRMMNFGKALPEIRKRINKDLNQQDLTKEKVLALVVTLMERTSIRIGNDAYEKLYGSFGLTTLKDKHAAIKNNSIKFSFKGKKGVEHSISLKSKKLAKLVQQCRDIPGKELFQYYDAESKRQSIDSGMVNEYLKQTVGEDFTSKDFRTWSGTVQALLALNDIGGFTSQQDAKQKTVAVLDKVSAHLGNTRTVCKKYYVHPALLDMYANNELGKWLKQLKSIGKNEKDALNMEEKILMKILKHQTVN